MQNLLCESTTNLKLEAALEIFRKFTKGDSWRSTFSVDLQGKRPVNLVQEDSIMLYFEFPKNAQRLFWKMHYQPKTTYFTIKKYQNYRQL